MRFYSFFPGGPPNLDVEAVNVLVLGFWPVVRSKVRIIIHRTAGGDGVEILGLVEVSTEEIVVEFEGLWFSVNEIVIHGVSIHVAKIFLFLDGISSGL